MLAALRSMLAMTAIVAVRYVLTSGNQTEAILGGGTRAWTVTFNPVTAGDKTATINFASNDPNTPNYSMNLVGTGTTGVLSLAQTGAFGTVPAGSANTRDIAMSNIGAMTSLCGTSSRPSEYSASRL